MIHVWILKGIFWMIKNAIKKKRKIKGLQNLQRINNYVNKDNELDIQNKQQQKTIVKQGKCMEKIEKDIATLKKSSHPPQEYICCRKCGCEIAKTKIKKRR